MYFLTYNVKCMDSGYVFMLTYFYSLNRNSTDNAKLYSEQRNLENIDEQIWKKLQYSKFQKFSALACFKGEKSVKKIWNSSTSTLAHIMYTLTLYF
jgi:hypothetical protein